MRCTTCRKEGKVRCQHYYGTGIRGLICPWNTTSEQNQPLRRQVEFEFSPEGQARKAAEDAKLCPICHGTGLRDAPMPPRKWQPLPVPFPAGMTLLDGPDVSVALVAEEFDLIIA